MNTFLDESIDVFKTQNSRVLRIDNDANSAIAEYLGAIIIVDTSSSIKDNNRIRKVISARQLGINKSYTLNGRNIDKKYKLSKDFVLSSNAKFPGIFETDFQFSNSYLLEVKYSIIKFGSILYQTDQGVSALDLLSKFDESTTEPVISTMLNIIDNCNSCKIQQVNNVLSFEGISINVKRYKKSDFAVNGNAGSVVTANGVYKIEQGDEYSDITSSRVIAIGMSSEDLKIAIFTYQIEQLKKEIEKIEEQLKNQKEIVARLNDKKTALTAEKTKFETLLSSSKIDIQNK